MRKYISFIMLFLLACSVPSWAGPAKLRLTADKAQLTGGLLLKEGAVHKWNNVAQRISWTTELEPGQYAVWLHYSEPYAGSVVAVSIGDQEIVKMLPASTDWKTFRTQKLGVVNIGAGQQPMAVTGQQTVTLQGRQLALVGDENKEALPDVAWLEMESVSEPPLPATVEGDARKLFDGKTLSGWEGNDGEGSMKWFRVEDGAIVAGSMTEPIPRNEFLRTTRKYGNFELKVKFRVRVEGNKGWNGGIQFRSVPDVDKPYEMVGYQADIFARRWGGLYDESRRNRFLGTILSEQPCNASEWNEYVLRCEGPRIRLWLNGKPVVDYTEPFAYTPHQKWGIIPQKGYIALQVHQRGNPYEIWYKDIEIKELKVDAPLPPHYSAAGQLSYGVPIADSLGWKVGVQAYDLKRVATFFEAVGMTAALGLKYIEGVNMRLSSETDESFGPDMSEEWKARTKERLSEAGVTLTSYYRRISPRDAERTFRFCREMGIMLVTDPVRVAKGEGSMDYYEALARKYNVRMVLTNHPEADHSPYYDPDTVLADLAGRDPLLGASIDIGHFMRDGRNPADIARKYADAGRLCHFHFRDVSGLRRDSRDCVIGTGQADIPYILKLLVERNIKPVIALEYERDMNNPLVDLIPSVGNIERIASRVGK